LISEDEKCRILPCEIRSEHSNKTISKNDYTKKAENKMVFARRVQMCIFSWSKNVKFCPAGDISYRVI
jgi:hypothetical protein